MTRARKKNRRDFLKASAITTAAVLGAPAVVTAAKTDKPLVVGEGEHKYEVHHEWPQLPSQFTWQTTHNVAVDGSGNLYVIHEGRADLKDHPSIFVFDNEGKYIRSFGSKFQGGGHGIEVRKERSEEVLYVCNYQQVKSFAKMTLKGETIWEQRAPMESGVYAEKENESTEAKWGRDRFMPTNFAFLNDGGFLLADGYGSFYIHRYDKDGKWLSCFGGLGKEDGKFDTPHGIWIDRRGGEEVAVVCDRAKNCLQWLTLDGKHLKTQHGYGLPANCDTMGKLLLVPELQARLTILDEKNEPVARLGEDIKRVTAPGANVRGDKAQWEDGKFVHPHDACFAADGSIFVAEWVATGRISKLKKLS